MSRVRRIAFLLVMVALVGASSTGLSRSACGKEIIVDGLLYTGQEGFDLASGSCVDGNSRCFFGN